MTNQIPIKVEDFNDYALTARERMEIFIQESSIVAWLMEMNFLQDKMILDLINIIAESKDSFILKHPACH